MYAIFIHKHAAFRTGISLPELFFFLVLFFNCQLASLSLVTTNAKLLRHSYICRVQCPSTLRYFHSLAIYIYIVNLALTVVKWIYTSTMTKRLFIDGFMADRSNLLLSSSNYYRSVDVRINLNETTLELEALICVEANKVCRLWIYTCLVLESVAVSTLWR